MNNLNNGFNNNNFPDPNFNNNNVVYQRIPEPEKVARPDMRAYTAKLKTSMKLAGAGIAVCFVSFGIGGFAAVASFGRGFAFVFLPFFGFAFCGFMAAMCSAKYTQADALVQVMNQIEMSDKIKVSDISYKMARNSNDTLYAIKVLMNCGNLSGYSIEGEYVVKKDGEVYNTSAATQYEEKPSYSTEFVSRYEEPENNEPKYSSEKSSVYTTKLSGYNRKESETPAVTGFCPKCGAPVSEGMVYCPKCGKKI